jgi:exonuclease-1
MGVDDLPQLLRPGVELPDSIATFSGKRLAVDVSGILYRGVKCKEGARLFATSPPVPITSCALLLQGYDALFESHKITPIYILDGCSPPIKEGTSKARRLLCEQSAEKLAEFIATNPQPTSEADLFEWISAIDKLKTGISYVREDVSADAIELWKSKKRCYLQTVFEAEAMCAYLEKIGAVQAVVSEDSDGFPLGIRTQIYRLNLQGKCCITDHLSVSQRPELGAGAWGAYDKCIYASFLGNDYIARPHGQGPVATRRLMSEMVATDAIGQAAIILRVARFCSRPEYATEFKHAVNMYLYSPVITFEFPEVTDEELPEALSAIKAPTFADASELAVELLLARTSDSRVDAATRVCWATSSITCATM